MFGLTSPTLGCPISHHSTLGAVIQLAKQLGTRNRPRGGFLMPYEQPARWQEGAISLVSVLAKLPLLSSGRRTIAPS